MDWDISIINIVIVPARPIGAPTFASFIAAFPAAQFFMKSAGFVLRHDMVILDVPLGFP